MDEFCSISSLVNILDSRLRTTFAQSISNMVEQCRPLVPQSLSSVIDASFPSPAWAHGMNSQLRASLSSWLPGPPTSSAADSDGPAAASASAVSFFQPFSRKEEFSFATGRPAAQVPSFAFHSRPMLLCVSYPNRASSM